MNHPIIKSVETTIIDLPSIRPHMLSMAVMKKQSMVIIQIHSDDEIIGLGEATTIGGISYADESPEGIKLVIDQYITPILLDADPTNINALMFKINKQVSGNYFAKSGIETALLDAQAKRLKISVSELLGGRNIEALDVLWTLASGNVQKDIEEAQKYIQEKRHRNFKVKIGRQDPVLDIAHVSAIKKALGNNSKVSVDVNQAWSESTAKYAIAQLEDAGIDLIEQPIEKANHNGLARLTQYFKTPIMADEACETVEDAFKLATLHAGSVFALKIAKAGGLYNVQKQAAIADASGTALYGGTMLEGSIGTIASAQVFATFPHLEWGTELFGPLLLTDDILTKPMDYSDFQLHFPVGIGLGIELDEDKLKFYNREKNTTVCYTT